MSAILSESQLNDFIAPGVACIKPVETLPAQQPPSDSSNPYEVTTEDKVAQQHPATNQPAQISLTDCLACSGCVTSAEAVLISLQSHEEVLSTLDTHSSLNVHQAANRQDGKVFVASVSPQAKASLAATYGITSKEAGALIDQLLCGPNGLRSGGARHSGFNWCIDTNRLRDIVLWATANEALEAASELNTYTNHDRHVPQPKKPVLASSCPGWVCYAEKTHPHILPHLSRLKSPQALAGTLVKSILARKYGVPPDKVWHVAVMPCFDKKLEASREELTDTYWQDNVDSFNNKDTSVDGTPRSQGTRDVDCVITIRELLMLADFRGISLPSLPYRTTRIEPFPDPAIDAALFARRRSLERGHEVDAGSSGGYSFRVLRTLQLQHPNSYIKIQRGRNPDIIEYSLASPDGSIIAKTARYYGFHNIQNLVKKLKPPRPSRLMGAAPQPRDGTGVAKGLSEYLYVEVMACPGGCTNGGGQVKVGDLPDNAFVEGSTQVAEQKRYKEAKKKPGVAEQREWLAKVDEAYYSADSDSDDVTSAERLNDQDGDVKMMVNETDDDTPNQTQQDVQCLLDHWCDLTSLSTDRLLYTTYRAVESDVGKDKKSTSDVERVAGLASSIGGGW